MKMINNFEGYNAFLSNFYECPIVDKDGILYPTNEHYFQAYKTLNIEERKMIAAAATPGQAKRMGRRVQLRADWEQVKESVMLDALRLKFSNGLMQDLLLTTGDQILVEGNWWHDNEWGDCQCDKCIGIKGKNKLGNLLMFVRNELREAKNAE